MASELSKLIEDQMRAKGYDINDDEESRMEDSETAPLRGQSPAEAHSTLMGALRCRAERSGWLHGSWVHACSAGPHHCMPLTHDQSQLVSLPIQGGGTSEGAAEPQALSELPADGLRWRRNCGCRASHYTAGTVLKAWCESACS